MNKPDKAFILAAGKGTRMLPLTKDMPKPMVELAGRPLIDRIIDKLLQDGVNKFVVNLHHFGNKLEERIQRRSGEATIVFSKEPVLLDTGGGLKQAARIMGDAPYYVLSGDAYWTDGAGQTALERLAEAWDDDRMDILILLQPVNAMRLTESVGDYDIDQEGRAIRAKDKNGQYMFTSIRIIKPQIFRGTPDGPFSFLDLMDKAEEQGRLYAVIHDADWEHISTPEDLARVNAAITETEEKNPPPQAGKGHAAP